ncbi:hypothetical protein SAMN05192583_3460 [Sphingomonas gellani]|uniref:Calcineurin-like phosphoesterase domain-containing protein n=1 Tax=Sphingomonas gellani TaxID=1166340 RepID=A0A1H8J0B9_9SPHN|nr:metallophosphoesterase [Sphingomonas gellani]SEN74079.1 hypothetical protein SAMN05192583_3460 [Sphingomonas gellani]
MTRAAKFLIILSLILAAALAFAGAMLWQARADPVVRRADVTLPGLAPGARVRMVLLSDIHMGTLAMDGGRLHRIVEQVNALHPDLVMIAGDFIFGNAPGSADRLGAPLVGALQALRPHLGTVAVLGNHDHSTGPEQVRALLKRAGVTVLDNAATVRGPIVIGGIGDDYSHHAKIGPTLAATRATGRPFVLLTHSPDLAPQLPPDARLLLAGHTHCGQGMIRGHVLAPEVSHRGSRYRCGLVRDGARTVIVTAGLGTSGVPFRFNVPPDMWLVTLNGPESDAGVAGER